MPHSDPEVAALLTSVRSLVGQAHRLSFSINETMEELSEFAQEVRADRRRTRLPYEGADRRASG